MEETEVPMEQVEEEIHHHATHGHGGEEGGPTWIGRVALSSAILAALAAVASLLSGHHSNEAMIERIRASDHWNYYQAKGIKSSVLATRVAMLEAMGKPVTEDDMAKREQYAHDQEEISEKAKEEESSSENHLAQHQMLARAVTFFQVAITICAISVLVRKRRFWLVSLGFGAIGLVFFVQGLLLRS